MRIVDTHHHLWDLAAYYYAWLTDRIEPKPYGDYAAIRENYLVEDFLDDLASTGVTRSVHLAAGMEPIEETVWLDSLADDKARSHGFPHAIVAGGDLTSPDTDRDLDKQQNSPRMRGVRQILSGAVTAGHPDVSTHPQWLRSVAGLAGRSLSLDLQVHPTQLPIATDVARANPELTLVLDHCALVNYRDPDALALWRRGLREIARSPNVRMKISAFILYDLRFTTESIRPVVHELIELFGTGRCFFGSNFPVDRLACSYGELWRRYIAAIADLTEDEQDELLYRSAARTYRIEA